VRRTIIIALEPANEQLAALTETCDLFTEVFNAVCTGGWQHAEKNGVRLHHAFYRPLKAQHPTLVSDLHVQARVKATEAIRSALALKRKGKKVSCPHSTSCPPRYNLHTFKIDWASRTVRLSTTAGRQTIRFAVPVHAERYAEHPVDTADLVCCEGRWAMHVSVTVPAPAVDPVNDVVGVDLGLAQPAVTSNNQFLGKKAWRSIENRLFKLKRRLQERGTKSAKRHLKKIHKSQARFRRDCDHVLSKKVVQACPAGGTIVLENLTDIRKRARAKSNTEAKRRLHGWSFAQIKIFIAYKAEERGCTVAGVDPRHTSQRCSRCGHTAKNNRRSRAVFKCRKCGFSLHADLNAARNIAAKYQTHVGMPDMGGHPVNVPIAGVGELVHSATCKPPALAGGR